MELTDEEKEEVLRKSNEYIEWKWQQEQLLKRKKREITRERGEKHEFYEYQGI